MNDFLTILNPRSKIRNVEVLNRAILSCFRMSPFDLLHFPYLFFDNKYIRTSDD